MTTLPTPRPAGIRIRWANVDGVRTMIRADVAPVTVSK